jgi:hypothetical protein
MKLKLLAAVVSVFAITSVYNTSKAEAAPKKAGARKTVKRSVQRAPVRRAQRPSFPFPFPYPDSGYGDRMPRSGPGTCGNSAWPCGRNNGGGDPGGSSGGG